MMKPYSVRGADEPMQYGVKTVRQLRQVKKVDLLSRECSSRQKQKQAIIFEYFRTQVDPIVQDCVAFLLCAQPLHTVSVMLDYLSHWRDGKRKEYIVPEGTAKTTKVQRIYLATQINPVITRIVTEIAKQRPTEVILFIIEELKKIMAETQVSNSTNNADNDANLGSDKRPATADSIRSPRRSDNPKEANQTELRMPAARPESAPVAASPKPLESVVMEIQIAM